MQDKPKKRAMFPLRLAESLREKAQTLALSYLPLIQALFMETNPQCVKFAMSWLKLCAPILRLPMILPTEPSQIALKSAIIHLALPQFQKRQRSLV